MKILGIDYGQAKIGLSLAEGKLAIPLGIIKFETWSKLSERLIEIISEEKIEKIVVGVSEGKTAVKTEEFITRLKKEISLPFATYDETLSTYEAQRLSREANLKRKKRNALEDAFAATVMLQSYLDNA